MSAAPPETAPARLPLLDAMRTVAALGVMAYHINEHFSGMAIFSRAYLLVDFFFLLSGFVLALVAEPRLAGGLGAGAFLKARWWRLWPVAAAGSLIALATVAGHNDWPVLLFSTVMALLFLPSPFLRTVPFPFNPVLWSLSMELVANAVHALVLWRIGMRGLLAVVALSGTLLVWQIFTLGMNNFPEGIYSWPLAFARVGFAYTLGIVIARRYRTRPARLVKHSVWLSAALAPLAAVSVLPMLPLAVDIGDAMATLVVLPLAFYAATCIRVPAGAGAMLAQIGTLSFPLYAVHYPISNVLRQWYDGWTGIVLAAVISLGVSVLLAFVFEHRRQRLRAERQIRLAPA